MATDTVSFLADLFRFSVHLGTGEVIGLQQVDSATAARPAELFSKMLTETRALIQSMNIDTIAINNDYIIGYDSYQTTIRLSFKSIEKFRKFVLEAGEIKGLSGFIFNKTSAKTAACRNQLAEKLLYKAKVDAEAIALASGKRITGIISVTDNTDLPAETETVSLGWRTMSPRRYMDFDSAGATAANIILIRSFRVRYAWK